MLKYRLLTALILIPIVLIILFYAPRTIFVGANALAILAAGWEWCSLSKIQSRLGKFTFLGVLALSFVLSFWITNIILWIAGVWWIGAGIIVLTVSPSTASPITKSVIPEEIPLGRRSDETKSVIPEEIPLDRRSNGISIRDLLPRLLPLLGLLILTPTFAALNLLHAINPELILWLFLFIWGADSFAYFAGNLWGKNKLIPRVSPGKTWEGFIAALITCIVIGVLASFRHLGGTLFEWTVFALIIGVVSVLGDLFESLIKRIEGVKDSGSLLPGHGGILDRIDSLTSAAPIFALFFMQFLLNKSTI